MPSNLIAIYFSIDIPNVSPTQTLNDTNVFCLARIHRIGTKHFLSADFSLRILPPSFAELRPLSSSPARNKAADKFTKQDWDKH